MDTLKILVQGLQLIPSNEFLPLEIRIVELVFPSEDYTPFLALSRDNKDDYYLDIHLGREDGIEYRLLFPITKDEKEIFLNNISAYILIMNSLRDMFLITINQYSGAWLASYYLPKDYNIKKYLGGR